MKRSLKKSTKRCQGNKKPCKILKLKFSSATVAKHKRNCDKLNKAAKIADDLQKLLNEYITQCTDIGMLMLDKEKIKVVDDIGKKASQDKQNSITDITWKYVPAADKSASSASDAKDVINQKKVERAKIKEEHKKLAKK